MRGGETQAFDAWHESDQLQKQGEIGKRSFSHLATIGIHVLSEQGDFPDALTSQVSDFSQHIVQGA